MGKVWQINIHWKYLKKQEVTQYYSTRKTTTTTQTNQLTTLQNPKHQKYTFIRTILKDKQLLGATFVNQYKFYITQNIYQ